MGNQILRGIYLTPPPPSPPTFEKVAKIWQKQLKAIYTIIMYIYIYMSLYADPGFDAYIVVYCTGLGCIVLYCKYRNTAAVFAPFGRGLKVNCGWWETNFWDVCTTQHFSFYPDICAKHLGEGFKIRKYRNTAFVFVRGRFGSLKSAQKSTQKSTQKSIYSKKH